MIARALLLVIFLLLAQPARAGNVVAMFGSGGGGGGGLCASCTPGDPQDIMCEDFGSSNLCATGKASVCQCSWTVAIEDHGTIVFSSSGVTFTPSDTSAQLLINYDVSGTSVINGSIKLNISAEDLDDGEFVEIGNSGHRESIRVRQTSGSLYVDLVPTSGDTISGTTAIDGVDDIIKVYTNEASSQHQLWVNGTSQGSGEGDWDTYTNFSFGLYNPAATMTFTITDIQVDDDTMP